MITNKYFPLLTLLVMHISWNWNTLSKFMSPYAIKLCNAQLGHVTEVPCPCSDTTIRMIIVITNCWSIYPPPRMFGMATIPFKCCMKTRRLTEKAGWTEILNPPYPYKRHGEDPSSTMSYNQIKWELRSRINPYYLQTLLLHIKKNK